MMRSSTAAGQGGAAPIPFQVFTAADMASALNGVKADHSTKNLLTSPGTLMIINEETGKAGKEFEWQDRKSVV